MRTRSAPAALVLCCAVLLAACNGGDVTVQVATEGPDGELRPVERHEITFVPYDRDSVFNALAERAEEPEPRPSPELREEFEEVIEAGDEWRAAERAWREVRDDLESISQRMEGLDRGSSEYLELFRQFDQREQELMALDRQRQQLFEEYDSLQRATVERADSLRAIIDAWEDRAFADFIPITDSILLARGVEVKVDTTDASGYATTRLPGGDWWVHTRYTPGPFEEFYWNIHLIPGETDTLRLTDENAEVRLRL